VSARFACSVVGSAATVRDGIAAFAERTQVDEIIITSTIYDHAARLRSYEILAEVQKSLGREPALQAN
jgi:alkanesulfonate monooxygenase SsuD/methylene tetrahydromethanopterin reductase-like flavin-dependent oxidoreductase (luciferase family)